MTRVFSLWLVFICAACTAQTSEQKFAAGDEFIDCEDCPLMVVVPAGSFIMGSPLSEQGRQYDEGEQHIVEIERDFSIGKYEVTVAEYLSFVSDTNYNEADGCFIRTELPTSVIRVPTDDGSMPGWRKDPNFSWRNPGFAQEDDHPVICVSWLDANAYAEWLSIKTGGVYRLLSDAEWEYAARAGTTTARHWGESAAHGCPYANGADITLRPEYPEWPIADCDDGYVYTSPVGSFTANEFGLHDTLGNSLEWVGDCWTEVHDTSASTAILDGDCSRRALRGGSWYDGPKMLRVANRYGYSQIGNNYSLGFRIAKEN
jgi:formylglycine-generating enzyme required for sulfatase activity